VLAAAVLVSLLVSPLPAGAAERRKVVTAFYPLAWVAAQVGGDRVAVGNLTPAGAEPHDLELTPDQMDSLLDADVAIVMGKAFQPAVERAAEQRDGVTVRLLDRLPTRPGDPHVWLDPVLMQRIVARVRTALTKADPAGRAVYQRNAADLDTRLAALDQRYRDGLSTCARHEIVTAHEAFGISPVGTDCASRVWPASRPTRSPTPSVWPSSPISWSATA
jgi:zinc transport system substrate-binding protein